MDAKTYTATISELNEELQLVRKINDALLVAVRKALEESNSAGASLFDLAERGDASNAVRDAKDAMIFLKSLNAAAHAAIAKATA